MSDIDTFSCLENKELLYNAEDIVSEIQNQIYLYFYQFFNPKIVKQFWIKLFWVLTSHMNKLWLPVCNV